MAPTPDNFTRYEKDNDDQLISTYCNYVNVIA